MLCGGIIALFLLDGETFCRLPLVFVHRLGVDLGRGHGHNPYLY